MPSLCRSPVTPAAAMILLLLQTGCSGTPFGEGLSRSFPAPGAAETPAFPQGSGGSPPEVNASSPLAGAQPAASPSPLTGAQPPARGPAVKPAKPAAPGAPPPTTGPSAPGSPPATTLLAPGEAPVRKVTSAARPLPYRVTIRLPEADPSAPAEVVTRALRATGVAFEVETIERISGPGSAPVAPPPPSPPPSPDVVPGAPTTRPAPPPR